MNIIDKLKIELKKNSKIKYISDDSSIVVKKVQGDGFDVGLYINPTDQNTYTVYYEGWHEHFTDEKKAINAFMFGLTNKCRLKAEFRGDKAYKWTLEYQRDGKWNEDSVTGTFIKPFWRKKEIRYLQNNYFPV